MQKSKIILAITGASGSIYARNLIEKFKSLNNQIDEIAVIFSDNAIDIWKHELGDLPFFEKSFKVYDNKNYFAPFASGSSSYNIMIICPCSMGMLGRIATGVSTDLVSRAADVMLKEKKRLIIVPRETPYNLIHINNMQVLTQAGAIICPATPSFYNHPQTIDDLVNTVVDRVVDLSKLSNKTFRWGE